MQSKVKLSKRQIKEDKFTTFMLESKDNLQEHWQTIVVGVLAIIVLVVAVSYYFSHRAAQQEEAAAQFANAMLDYQRGDDEIATLGFTEVIDKYDGSDPAENALFMLCRIHLDGRDYEEAQRYFERYLDSYRHDAFRRASCYAGLAAIAEDKGESATAAEHFEAAVAEDPEGALVADYHFGALRNYLAAGDTEAAAKHLQILEEDFGESGYARSATLLYSEKQAAAQS